MIGNLTLAKQIAAGVLYARACAYSKFVCVDVHFPAERLGRAKIGALLANPAPHTANSGHWEPHNNSRLKIFAAVHSNLVVIYSHVKMSSLDVRCM